MKLVVLPGNTPPRKEWLAKIYSGLKTQFDDIEMISYDHYENGNELISIDDEVEKLYNFLKKIDGEYVIVAKTAGVVVALPI